MKKISLLISGVFLTVGVNAHQLGNGADHDHSWNWNDPSHTHEKLPEGTVANVGECYVPAYVEATCEKVVKKVLVKEEYIERDCTDCGALIPKVVKERIMISPKKTITEIVPALYENVGKEVLVTPARTVWKKGNFTETTKQINGETYCLVEEPAQYKTEFKKVLRVPETTKTKVIPAVYKDYEKTIYVKSEPVVKRIPAEYKNIEVCVDDKAGKYEWRSIVCEENATKSVLTQVEEKLAAGKHLTSSAVDGIIDDTTENALKSYQRANGLKVDGLVSIDTVNKMGISYK